MRSKRGGWSLNTYLKQVGERESMITKTVEMKSLLSTRRPFLGTLEKPAVHTGNRPASAVSLLIVTSVSLKVTQCFLLGIPRKKGLSPTSLKLLLWLRSELGGIHHCSLLVQGRRHFSSKTQPLPEEAEHPCSAELQL